MSIFSLYIFGVCLISLGGIGVYVYYLSKKEKKHQEDIREAQKELDKLLDALQTIKERKAEKAQVSIEEVKREAENVKESVPQQETPKQAPAKVKKIYPKKNTKPRSNKRK